MFVILAQKSYWPDSEVNFWWGCSWTCDGDLRHQELPVGLGRSTCKSAFQCCCYMLSHEGLQAPSQFLQFYLFDIFSLIISHIRSSGLHMLFTSCVILTYSSLLSPQCMSQKKYRKGVKVRKKKLVCWKRPVSWGDWSHRCYHMWGTELVKRWALIITNKPNTELRDSSWLISTI